MMEDKLPPMDPALREIFALAYRYRQKHQHPTYGPSFWNAAASEMSALAAKLNHPFAQALLLCCYEDIERELKETTVEQVQLF